MYIRFKQHNINVERLETKMSDQFSDYVNNALYNSNSPEGMMLYGHTVFEMSRTDDISYLKESRKRWIINNFVNYENCNRQSYNDFYNNHISDNWNTLLCKRIEFAKDNVEYDDDVDKHYKLMALKNDSLVKLNEMLLSKNNDNLAEDNESYISEDEDTDNESVGYFSTSDSYDEEEYDDYYDKCLDEEGYEEDDYDY